MERVIGIYLGGSQPFAKIQLNIAETNKINNLVKNTGCSKSGLAREMIFKSLNTNSIEEAIERIIYVSTTANIPRVNTPQAKGEACKYLIRKVLDSY